MPSLPPSCGGPERTSGRPGTTDLGPVVVASPRAGPGPDEPPAKWRLTLDLGPNNMGYAVADLDECRITHVGLIDLGLALRDGAAVAEAVAQVLCPLLETTGCKVHTEVLVERQMTGGGHAAAMSMNTLLEGAVLGFARGRGHRIRGVAPITVSRRFGLQDLHEDSFHGSKKASRYRKKANTVALVGRMLEGEEPAALAFAPGVKETFASLEKCDDVADAILMQMWAFAEA
jgi:hypothetical protein